MAKITKSAVVKLLHGENYPAAVRLGMGAIRYLKAIAKEKDFQLAAKAVYVAGLMNEPKSAEIVAAAAKSRKTAVRIAAANASQHLSCELAEPVLTRLLRSRDLGVRKTAIRAAGGGTQNLRLMLTKIKQEDTEVSLRKLARKALQTAPKTPSAPA